MMHWILNIIFIGLLTVTTATAGSLTDPYPPDSSRSAMYTLEDIYKLLMNGTVAEKRAGAFEEPKNGPGVSSGFPDLNDIYEAAPSFNENAATVYDVVPNKCFWALGNGDNWGLKCGDADSSKIESPVLKTGQTKLVDNYYDWNNNNGKLYEDDAYWAEQGFGIDCSNKDGARFKVNKKPDDQKDDGTVSDNKTGLMWAQNANFLNASLTWYDAFTSVKNLNTLPIGCGSSGDPCYTDWRLPNIKELQSLIDYGHTAPALPENHEDAFTQDSVKNYYYWSSTTNLSNPYAQAWTVYMITGGVSSQPKGNPCYVWPVRGGKK